MNCEECIYQFKCYTVVKQPRKIAGVRFTLAYSCSECIASPTSIGRQFGKPYAVCTKTNMLVHNKSIACADIELSPYKKSQKRLILETLERTVNAIYDKRPVYCFDSEERKIRREE